MGRPRGPRARFTAPQFDPAEGRWLVVVYFLMSTGSYHRSRRWYRSSRDAWKFVECACTDLRGEVAV